MSSTLRGIALSWSVILLLTTVIGVSGCSNKSSPPPETSSIKSVGEIREFFEGQGKTVLTFVGYSGAGYEDPTATLHLAKQVLDQFESEQALVNIGATPDGIGAIYELAQQLGFVTTGIVSTQAKEYGAEISPYVDHVFFVEDESWCGKIKGTDRLSPTSTAMVENSDVVVGIGGGEVARDEMLAAQHLGKDVRFFPADLNHKVARDKDLEKGLPEPTDFRGAAFQVLGAAREHSETTEPE